MESTVTFEDDFEEYHARATSGGSLYGLLRRQAFIQGGSKRSPEFRHIVRKRSKSLIPPSVALPEDKSILKLLCEYTETSRRQTDLEQRRHSTACLEDARDASHIHPLSPIRCSGPRKTGGQESAGGLPRPDLEPIPSMPEEDEEEDEDLSLPRPATGLRPPEGGAPALTPPNGSSSSIFRRRSFTVTPKGLINEGDDLVAFQQQHHQQQQQQQQQQHQQSAFGNMYFGSTGSDLHLLSKTSRSGSYTSLGSVYSGASSDTQIYRVLMLGGPGVGKSALTQQFLTSEYMAAQNTSFDDGIECTVPVLLDGEETVVEIIDLPYTGEPRVWQEYEVDCVVVVYSITDRRSFKKAVDLLGDIRREERFSGATLVLVANKTDLVRSRLVGEQEAKAAAQTYDCKYSEVSAILNHRVDELFVGVIKQLRYRPDRERRRRRASQQPAAGGGSGHHPVRMNSGDAGCLSNCHQGGTLSSLFASPLKFLSKSCENLL